MNITLNQSQENRLLERWEVQGTIAYEQTTPRNQELIAYLGGHFKVDPTHVVMKQILPLFGHRQAQFRAFVYQSIAAREKTEPVTHHQKKQAEEQKKAEKKEE